MEEKGRKLLTKLSKKSKRERKNRKEKRERKRKSRGSSNANMLRTSNRPDLIFSFLLEIGKGFFNFISTPGDVANVVQAADVQRVADVVNVVGLAVDMDVDLSYVTLR